MKLCFPLKSYKGPIPEGSHPGSFGSIRKYDVHTGVDLYCQENQSVFSMEVGVVCAIIPFTGSQAGSNWWNDTSAVMIKGISGVILYGEIKAKLNLLVGQKVLAGQEIGKVMTVLKKDKGLPMNMLHVELYNKEVPDAVIWSLNSPKPESLENPTLLLKKSLEILFKEKK